MVTLLIKKEEGKLTGMSKDPNWLEIAYRKLLDASYFDSGKRWCHHRYRRSSKSKVPIAPCKVSVLDQPDTAELICILLVGINRKYEIPKLTEGRGRRCGAFSGISCVSPITANSNPDFTSIRRKEFIMSLKLAELPVSQKGKFQVK